MKVLLDTCAFLWIALDSPELSGCAREIFRSRENEIYLSAVSTWEIAIKYSLGAIRLPENPETYVPRLRKKHRIDPLALDEATTLHLPRLPALHKDPFDRMLICQAILGGMVLLTPDGAIARYPVRSMW